jgi:hypothetical protein
MLPPSARDFKDIYVVFELMETDLHQVRPRGQQKKQWVVSSDQHGWLRDMLLRESGLGLEMAVQGQAMLAIGSEGPWQGAGGRGQAPLGAGLMPCCRSRVSVFYGAVSMLCRALRCARSSRPTMTSPRSTTSFSCTRCCAD